LQEKSGDGSESSPQGAPKSDAPPLAPPTMEPAQVTADLRNNLMMKPANEARSFIRVMQNGSWAVGLQVSKALS
jgi:hypothetical protein